MLKRALAIGKLVEGLATWEADDDKTIDSDFTHSAHHQLIGAGRV
jgi:hypothetical protein